MASTLAELPAPLHAPTSKRVVRDSRGRSKAAIGDITPNNIGTLRKLNSVLFPVAYSDKFYRDVLDPRTADFCKLVYYNDLPVGAVCCRVEGAPNGGAKTDAAAQPVKLYIMTLGVLAPYRRLGLASLLLSHVLAHASRTHLPPSSSQVRPCSSENPSSGAPAPKAPKLQGKEKKAAKLAAAAADKENKNSSAAATATKDAKAKEAVKVEPVPPLKEAYVHVQHGNVDARTFYEGKGFEVVGEVEGYYKRIEPRGCWVLAREVDVPPPSAAASADGQGKKE